MCFSMFALPDGRGPTDHCYGGQGLVVFSLRGEEPGTKFGMFAIYTLRKVYTLWLPSLLGVVVLL